MPTKTFETAVALICVTETENERLMKITHWKPVEVDGDPQIYYESFFDRNGRQHRIVAAKADEMGMTASAVLTTKLIHTFQPRYVIMVGIAAGIVQPGEGQQLFGDVAVADFVWNHSAGKFVPASEADLQIGTLGFKPRPTNIALEPWLLPYIEAAATSKENETYVHMGTFASGSAVIADAHMVNTLIRNTFGDTIALDMEAYGVMYAASRAAEPRPAGIVIKSICDYADGNKNDHYQRFAAKTSCEFAQLLYEKFLPL